MAVVDDTRKALDGLGVAFDQFVAKQASGKLGPKVYIADPATELYVTPPSKADIQLLALEGG
ncbi:MAG: hypothetical protein L0Y60_17855, partial [Beijerinckiaceae bacterium]|nr:hypothetical protein [Beijerinckiaceae bacterium]